MKVLRLDADLAFAKANPTYLFLYPDNDTKRGKPNIRDAPNAIGVPVSKKPCVRLGLNPSHFYSDSNLANHIKNIDAVCERVEDLIKEQKYTTLVLPTKALGSSLHMMHIKAPDTYKYLTAAIAGLEKYALTYKKEAFYLERTMEKEDS